MAAIARAAWASGYLDAVTKYRACSMGAISFHGKPLMIAMDV
jgi:hypothetical protein